VDRDTPDRQIVAEIEGHLPHLSAGKSRLFLRGRPQRNSHPDLIGWQNCEDCEGHCRRETDACEQPIRGVLHTGYREGGDCPISGR